MDRCGKVCKYLGLTIHWEMIKVMLMSARIESWSYEGDKTLKEYGFNMKYTNGM